MVPPVYSVFSCFLTGLQLDDDELGEPRRADSEADD